MHNPKSLEVWTDADDLQLRRGPLCLELNLTEAVWLREFISEWVISLARDIQPRLPN